MLNELKSYHSSNLKTTTIKELFAQDSSRADRFKIEELGLYFDYSKTNIDQGARDLLIQLTNQIKLNEKIKELFAGDIVNPTENRAALHMALRGSCVGVTYQGIDVAKSVAHVQAKMEQFVQDVYSGKHLGFTGKKIKTIVNIGIGGSDLGPVLACEALAPYKTDGMSIHFISSIDGYDFVQLFSQIDIETSLFVIASKTFTTQETITNAQYAKSRVLAYYQGQLPSIASHFVALSTNTKAVTEFGINPHNMFEFWDFVGGRYSLMSAIGLSVMLYIGVDNFRQMQKGALSVDQHFVNTTDYTKNIPVMLALVGIWNINVLGYTSLIVSPYNTRLKKLSAYIEQLEMESNGKSVNKKGERITYDTAPVIWGDSGINGQHAYYQMLHQGSRIVPMDIIVSLRDKYSIPSHHDILISNAFAQAQAFAMGKTYEEAYNELITSGMDKERAEYVAKHKVFTANRPTNMLLLEEVTPYTLGQLIAIYEHKAFVQGVIWDVNTFDQMGVELGKKLANNILAVINGAHLTNEDSSTSNLIKYYLDSKEV